LERGWGWVWDEGQRASLCRDELPREIHCKIRRLHDI
jgi:hypothetical protein